MPQVPWNLSTIAGDSDLLFLAIHNLLDNALKYTKDGDAIELRAYERDHRVLVEVADTGAGIPEKDIPHVWDELYRSDAVHGTPGSGLELPLVRAIIERHGGTVSLRSREGQGTVVTVSMPFGNDP